MKVKLTAWAIGNGVMLCDCGKYAYVSSAEVTRLLPRLAVLELCGRCGSWMLPARWLAEAGMAVEERE